MYSGPNCTGDEWFEFVPLYEPVTFRGNSFRGPNGVVFKSFDDDTAPPTHDPWLWYFFAGPDAEGYPRCINLSDDDQQENLWGEARDFERFAYYDFVTGGTEFAEYAAELQETTDPTLP